MSLKVSFLEQGRGVEILAEGVVEGREIVAVNRQIYDARRLPSQRYQIIDKSRCTEYAVTADEIAAIADLDRQASLINPNIVIAVVESKSLQFSLTELWQAHLHNCPFLTKSFSSREAAEAWVSEHSVRS